MISDLPAPRLCIYQRCIHLISSISNKPDDDPVQPLARHASPATAAGIDFGASLL
ncbi:MAG: hypothetical protein RBT34_04305 [Anaerolineaceae bacterium]|jgi:hypothetical protein|nr:hypothetical protein [Anaerolineaceae bacterium]